MIKHLTLLLTLTVAFAPLKAQLKYHDVSQYPLLGKIQDDTETRYERLPASLKDVVRKPVWELAKNTAGLAIRFKSNTTSVGAKWELYQDRVMNHMAPTGIKGLDLYCLVDGKWIFVNSGRPGSTGKKNNATIISDMEKKEREFMLYLPLYDGITAIEIGVDSTATISPSALDLPTQTKPVICYGTSILQGACASRPGMAHTNILSRWFDREFINLGFSGNAQLDYEIAELITGKEASLIILDFMPNVNAKMVEEKLEKFYQIVRSKSPNTPIVFIENPMFPHSLFDEDVRKGIVDKNKALHIIFDKIKKLDKNIILIPSEKMIGTDNESTVDGVHFTDLGFMRYSEYLYPILKPLITE